MSVRTRLALGILVVVSVGFGLLVRWLAEDLKPSLRSATEEPLIDTARFLAILASPGETGTLPRLDLVRSVVEGAGATTFAADIHGLTKTRTDAIVYVTDRAGVVLWDSRGPAHTGRDLSTRLDVGRTLKGKYGARTSHEIADSPDVSVMFVAAPIVARGRTIGVLSVGKPTTTVNSFIEKARERMATAAVATGLAVVALGLFVSGMVTRPIGRLADYARALRDGGRPALPDLGASEVRQLGQALEEMREALEGRRTVERYVRALAHEVKAPLAAIQGAAELLDEKMEPEPRARFLANIRSETARLTRLVERLMLLSSLEARRGVESAEPVDLCAIVREVLADLALAIATQRLEVAVESAGRADVRGERFLLRQAVANLVQNGVEFSRSGGSIVVAVALDQRQVVLTVDDSGPGVPEFALEKVFERFYSLERPGSGKKSSGLGLALVREIAQIHGGSVSLENRPTGGARARLVLPAG